MHPIDMIFYWAGAAPNRPAIIQPDMTITYRALAESIESVAERIAQYGFDPAQPVAVSIEHQAKLLVVCLALIRSGLTAVPIAQGGLPHLRAFGIENLIYANLGPVLSGGKAVRFEDSWLPKAASARRPRARPTAYGSGLFFTSGTTGKPKKIVQNPDNLLHRLSQPRLFADYARVLIFPGLNTQWGFVYALQAFWDGKTACFALIGDSLRLVSSFGVDLIVASTEQLSAVATAQESSGRFPVDSLKAIITAGSVVTKDFLRRVQSLLCQKIYVNYASTEAGIAAAAAFDVIEHIPAAVGFVTPWTELEIVDEEGKILPAGTQGRLRYRTEMFLRNIGADPDQPGDHWYYPGDLGHVTEDGVLCILGRSDDVINRGGVKMPATEIEERLVSCAGVVDAAVCAVQSPAGRGEVWAAIVTDGVFDLQRFKLFLDHSNLCQTKIDDVLAVEKIPRTELGKIQRQTLRDMLLAMRQRPAVP